MKKISFCKITVQGRGHEAGRSSTHRPVNDTTRPLNEFFRGMSAYGRAVSDHVMGCEHCTPRKILPLLKNPKLPVTMLSGRLIRRLLRNDPRTPRMEYLKVLSDVRDIPWLARFCSEKELWACLLNIQSHAEVVEADYRARWPGWQGKFNEKWNLPKRVSAAEGWCKQVPADEVLGKVVPDANRRMVRKACLLKEAGLKIPSSKKAFEALFLMAVVQTT